jgi:hypothetical protein
MFCLIDDKKRQPGCKEFFKSIKELAPMFKKMNNDGWGVYFSVNKFNKSRKECDCIELSYIYSDLDIAKKGDGQTKVEKQNKKQKLLKSLLEKCEPSCIIDTSNGLQPLWAITDNDPSPENKIRYKQVLKGIVKWSKTVGSFGDNVYDISRILRLPGYYHQKEEPYLCEIIHQSEKKYPLSALEQIFPYEEEIKEVKIEKVFDNSNPVFVEIEKLDFQELVIKAFASVGRPVSFDKSGHLLDPIGKTTGTFLGREGNRDYLASSSHEPFRGNRITAISEILKVDYSDAYQWICKTYGFDFKKLIKQEKIKEQIKNIEVKIERKDKRYTWGTRYLDTHFAIIKPTNFIVVAAKRSSGKTSYTFFQAIKNAEMGHKVLYISLEMETEDILDDFSRKYSNITIEEEFDRKIPIYKQQSYEFRKNEIKSTPNLFLEGIRRSGDVSWELIEEIIKKYTEIDMVFIDNLDLIAGRSGETDWNRQKRLVSQMMSFCSSNQTPIILIHHYRKSIGGKDFGMDEMSGSGKIGDGADRVVKVVRITDPMAVFPEKFKSTLYLQKGRGYPEHTAEIYFIRGNFVDNPPAIEEYAGKYEKNDEIDDIVESFGGEVVEYKLPNM